MIRRRSPQPELLRQSDAPPQGPTTSTESQPWGFIPLEIGIVSAEEQRLQAVSVRYHRAGNSFAFDLEKLSQAVDGDDNLSVNQRIILG